MSRKEIDDIVCAILMNDGPDGHVDGHDVITGFIVAVAGGTGDLWAREYREMLRQRRASR